MSNFESLLLGFSNALSPSILIYGFAGCLAGTLVGVLPGIGPALTIALLLPFTFKAPAVAMFVLFAGIYYGGMYGGSTTAILLNTPGESSSVVTAIEGNKMAKRGFAGKALATAAIGSFVAGTIGTIALTFFAPLVVNVALSFGPAEYFSLMVLAAVSVTAVLGSSVIRGMISLSFGLLIGLVGVDLQSGQARFTFGGKMELLNGIEVVTAVVGLFAVGDALFLAWQGKEKKRKTIISAPKSRWYNWMTKEDWKRSWKPWLRGSLFGFPIGALPTGGAEVPTLLSYYTEKKLSKKPEEFGKGAIEGVAGPEAANNANAAGALVPLLALGLPTSATAAVILVALQTYNIQPGPMLFSTNPEIVWTLIASLFIGNTLLLLLNLPLVRVWAKLLNIPRPYLFSGITAFALMGAYVANNAIFDLWIALGVGVIGFTFRRFGVPITPLIIGVILGPMAELQMRRSLQISGGEFSALYATSMSKILYVILFLVIIGPLVWNFKKKLALKK